MPIKSYLIEEITEASVVPVVSIAIFAKLLKSINNEKIITTKTKSIGM